MGSVSDADATVDAAPGAFGRYEVTGELGAGACGTVYSAKDPSLDRVVAIKALHADTLSEVQAERIRAEALALAKLSHPNVVPIYDVGQRDGTTYIVMEKIDGRSLGRWLEGKRSRSQILETFIGAGEGLLAAHELGLVHRDFKPDNVLIDDRGRARVVDFGLVSGLDLPTIANSDGRVDAETVVDRLTQTGALAGTPAYMAPEQLRGRRVDARADQFGFCVALYEALAGRRPFSGTSLGALVDSVTESDRSKLGRGTRVPTSLLPILRRGLAAKPNDRYPSMRELLADIREARPTRRRWWLLGLLAGAGVVAVVAGASLRAEPPAKVSKGPAATPPAPRSREAEALVARARKAAEEGRYDRATELGLEAADLSNRAEARVEALSLAAEGWYWMSEVDRARDAAERAMTIAERSDNPRTKLIALLTDLETMEQSQWQREGERLLGEARSLVTRADASPSLEARYRFLEALHAMDFEDWDTADEAIRRGLERLDEGPLDPLDVALRGPLLLSRAQLQANRADANGATQTAGQAVIVMTGALGPRHPQTLEIKQGYARILASEGQPEHAAEVMREVIDATSQLPWAKPSAQLDLKLTLIYVLYQAGQYDEAAETIAETLETGKQHPRFWEENGTEVLRMKLYVDLALGNPIDSLGDVATIGDRTIEQFGPEDPVTIQTRMLLASVHLDAGQTVEAETIYDELEDLVRAYPVQQAELERGRARIRLARGQLEEACFLAKASVTRYRNIEGQEGQRARARRTYAEALFASGREQQAQAQLQRARSDYAAAGPAWWRERQALLDEATRHGVQLEPF